MLGLLMRQVGLPPLVGYLAAGFTLSIYGYESNEILKEVAHAGVLLLLFSVGLKLRLKTLVRLEIFAGSLAHMLITVVIVYLLLTTVLQLDSQLALLIALARKLVPLVNTARGALIQ